MPTAPGLPAVALTAYSAPAFNSPSVANGEVFTTLTLENTLVSTANNQPFTIGLPFKKGQLKMSDGLVGKIAGQADIALQFDPKSTWPDGSVRHGIISGIVPSIGASALVPMGLARSTAARDNTPVSPATIAATGINAVATAVIGGVTYTADADAALTAGSGLKLWLAGPVCTEYTFEVPYKTAGGTPHQVLKAQFAVRYYSSLGIAKVDITTENSDFYYSGADPLPVRLQDITYDASLSIGGAAVYTKAGLVHWPARRWMKSNWLGTETALHVKFERLYLQATGMVPNYDPATTMTEAQIAARWGGTSYNTEPMGTGAYAGYMPTSGGREDIGIHPRWTADWIVSQDKRVKRHAIENSKAGGAWEVHLRGRVGGPTDGEPIDVVHFPYADYLSSLTDADNPSTGKNEHILINNDTALALGHQIDSAHQPCFSAIPYMLTGDYFHLEELVFWSSHNSWQANPSARGYHQGLYKWDQLRGQAWSMRSAALTATLLPDTHPIKPAHLHILNSNLAYYNAQLTDNGSANVLGYCDIGEIPNYNPGEVSPWMDDFMTAAVGYASAMGFTEAARLLAWKAKFPVGRMLNMCWVGGAPPRIKIRDTNVAPIYTTFPQVFNATYADKPAVLGATCGSTDMAVGMGFTQAGTLGEFASTPIGGAANMQPALAYAVDGGYPDADLAMLQFNARSVKPNYAADGNQFNIVPTGLVLEPAPESPGDIPPLAFFGGAFASVPSGVTFIEQSMPEEPAPSEVTGVTITPTTATGSTTFTATVQGTNGPSQAVTWTPAGMVSGGVFTAPAQASDEQIVIVKATSVQAPSFSASATVTIAALPRVAPPPFVSLRKGRGRGRARGK